MVTRSKVDRFVRQTLADQVGVTPDAVTDDKQLMADLELDSLDIVEAIVMVEEEFDTKVPDKEVERIAKSTVGQVIEYLCQHLGAEL